MDMVVSSPKSHPKMHPALTWHSNVCPDGLGPVNPNLPSGAPPAPVAGSKLPSGVSVIKTTATINSKTTILTQTVGQYRFFLFFFGYH